MAMLHRIQDSQITNKALIALNRRFGKTCVPHHLNEEWIADFYGELIDSIDPANAYFWLLYARLMEATLLCAGNSM